MNDEALKNAAELASVVQSINGLINQAGYIDSLDALPALNEIDKLKSPKKDLEFIVKIKRAKVQLEPISKLEAIATEILTELEGDSQASPAKIKDWVSKLKCIHWKISQALQDHPFFNVSGEIGLRSLGRTLTPPVPRTNDDEEDANESSPDDFGKPTIVAKTMRAWYVNDATSKYPILNSRFKEQISNPIPEDSSYIEQLKGATSKIKSQLKKVMGEATKLIYWLDLINNFLNSGINSRGKQLITVEAVEENSVFINFTGSKYGELIEEINKTVIEPIIEKPPPD